MKNLKLMLTCLAVLSLFIQPAAAVDWPQEIIADEGTVVVYQPQPETLSGNVLTGRAAMSIELKASDEPIFGVFWFTSKIETDRDQDQVIISHIKVERVAWPDSKDAAEQRFTAVVEKALSRTALTTELSKLTASLSTSEKLRESLEGIKNDPPVIMFSDELAVLLSYDGEPIFSAIEDSPYERALNTPLTVVKVAKKNQYYLTSGSLWYESKKATGPWSSTDNPPSDLKAMVPKSDGPTPAKVPSIVSVTEPTELIVTDGKADWQSLAGGQLLYVKNTETAWVRDLPTGNMYILLSGRWFRSKSEEGPWTFVRSDELPTSFQEIPPESDIGGLRTSIAGTEEADQAVIDAQIPQTAAIRRDEAKLDVTYDGEPKFEKIKGTDVSYAVNTGAQVLLIDGRYYAVDSGVWFSSAAAKGPWIVADTVPMNQIAEIPVDSPVYNVTHVTVYESTKEVVYVGYTPGYMWSYPYYGVPIYGTGWYYPPYYGRYYYPRPPTWGLHVGYNPWTGWSYGVSWGGPFFRVGVSWGGGYGPYRYTGCCGGRYGGGYRHNTININTGDINIGNNVNIGNRDTARNKLSNNTSRDNLYNRAENRQRNASSASLNRDFKQARHKSQRPNNVYAGRDGQVARRQGDQWETRSGNKWQNVPQERNQRPQSQQRPQQNVQRPQQRPQQSQQRSQFNRQNMNSQHRARQMGSQGGRRRR